MTRAEADNLYRKPIAWEEILQAADNLTHEVEKTFGLSRFPLIRLYIRELRKSLAPLR